MAVKLDIFPTLAALDRREFDYLERQTDELRKAFTPYQTMRWMSGLKRPGDEQDLMLSLVNEIVNIDYSSLSDHPELQYKLLASCGLGNKLDHQWIPPARAKKSIGSLFACLSKFWPEANDMEIKILLSQFDRETFQTFLLDGGCGLDEQQDILDAYDRYCGREPEAKKKKSSAKAKSSAKSH